MEKTNLKLFTGIRKKQNPKNNETNPLAAFLVGGHDMRKWQVFHYVIKALFPYLSRTEINSFVVIAMIFLGALLTAIGIYDDIGKFAGAGSIVPITGFANSVVSPAMEFKTEGFIYGMESKMFIVAGPIIISGIVSSVIVGIIYLIIGAVS